jgi:cell division protein FtsZ
VARPAIHHREGPLHHREAPMMSRGGEPVATREQMNAREQLAQREVAQRSEPPMRVVRRQPLSNSDYAALDKPTVQRQRAVGDGLRPESEDEDLLDIPAFLRRQAD